MLKRYSKLILWSYIGALFLTNIVNLKVCNVNLSANNVVMQLSQYSNNHLSNFFLLFQLDI